DVGPADALAGRSPISAKATPASSSMRLRRARMRDPTTRMRLAGFCSSQVNEALLRADGCAGLERLSEARAPHESSGSRCRHELAVLDEDSAPQEDVLRGADDRGAPVEVVVALGVVG